MSQSVYQSAPLPPWGVTPSKQEEEEDEWLFVETMLGGVMMPLLQMLKNGGGLPPRLTSFFIPLFIVHF